MEGVGVKISITIPGTIRSKKNSKRIFARGKFKTVLPSIAYLKWEKAARAEALIQIPKNSNFPVQENVHVTVHAHYKGQRPDLSGVLESVGDCFEGILWENDRQIVSWDGSRLSHDLENPRTEITLTTERRQK